MHISLTCLSFWSLLFSFLSLASLPLLLPLPLSVCLRLQHATAALSFFLPPPSPLDVSIDLFILPWLFQTCRLGHCIPSKQEITRAGKQGTIFEKLGVKIRNKPSQYAQKDALSRCHPHKDVLCPGLPQVYVLSPFLVSTQRLSVFKKNRCALCSKL